ncbi:MULTISPECIES: TIGR03618 family F420-dependent PPOX class oxidoreductase [Kitasatospora]|uniref:Putative oxidoreductase n=1 Tax=Kitasatospora setae (strain ATCC 33774 / DSM 43861 / JCM 3304 / KCC A-0304 / NBRC 14216 / KM-6054) TaxID=452652 RepID=E4NIZ6_KITSK|nr:MULTISPECIES: TIGR03618 family F420-dependent PPOX class oxidoreductase [Kitasatospora]BAJ32944.1 putative oxidoreductase [Kitasatospora setae KM-6054]
MTKSVPPRRLSEDALSDLLARQRFGTLASVRRSGHPHLTTMLYGWDAPARTLRFSSTDDRAKVAHLRANPHASLHVQGEDVWSFAVAEGEAEVSAPTTVPGDAVGRELLAMFPPDLRPADENAFFAQLVAERRVVVRLRVTRLYGTALDIEG